MAYLVSHIFPASSCWTSADDSHITVSNLGAAVKLIATLIEQSAWIFSYYDEAEEEKATQEEDHDDQALELPDQPEGEPEIFHEAETSIYETAPQEPPGEDTRRAGASPHTLGPINHASAALLTA